jgi:hypothetical protein
MRNAVVVMDLSILNWDSFPRLSYDNLKEN